LNRCDLFPDAARREVPLRRAGIPVSSPHRDPGSAAHHATPAMLRIAKAAQCTASGERLQQLIKLFKL
jgi:hypothetical protein